MAANISEIRASVRTDLHDDPADRWTDAVLDRHIERAVLEYSLHAPREAKTAATTTPGSRDIDISTFVGLITVDAVEYPTGEFPPQRVAFSRWANTLTLDLAAAPAGAEPINVYWTRSHTLDGASSTIPPVHDDVLAAGAAAYAALDWTSFASNRINTGGEDVWGRYKAFAAERLRYFNEELRRVGRANSVRQRRMFIVDTPHAFEQQDRVKY